MASKEGVVSYPGKLRKITANEERVIKLATAKIVEELLGNLEANVCSEKDIKLLVDLVYRKELKINELNKIDMLQQKLLENEYRRNETKPIPCVHTVQEQGEQTTVTMAVMQDQEATIAILEKDVNFLHEKVDVFATAVNQKEKVIRNN